MSTRSGTSQAEHNQTLTSPAQFRARIKIIRDVIEAGGGFSVVGTRIGISTAGVHHWVNRWRPDLARKLAENGKTNRSQYVRLTRERIVERLSRIIDHGIPKAAVLEGVSDQAIRQWLDAMAPDGAAVALLDYKLETE